MQKTTRSFPSLACAMVAAISSTALAQELIVNGSFARPQLAPWVATTPAGTSVALVSENSPFDAVYPLGIAAARLQDDDSDFENPQLRAVFPETAAITFSFDFKVPAVAPGSVWYVAWEGDDDTTAFFFALGGQDGQSLEFNQNFVAPLIPNVWYHVEGWADAPGQKVEGFVLNDRGERATFSGGFPFGVAQYLHAVVVSDGDAERNQPVILDNFSSQLPTLNIGRGAEGEIILTWNATAMSLQASATIGANADWTDLASTNGRYVAPATEPRRFFRLISR